MSVSTNEEWINTGRKSINERAKEEVDNLLKKYPGVSVEDDKISRLLEIMRYKDLDFKQKLKL